MDSPTEGNTSSDTSESDHEEEYIVQDVLAERESDDGVKLYLVKWENYSDERWDHNYPSQQQLTQLFA